MCVCVCVCVCGWVCGCLCVCSFSHYPTSFMKTGALVLILLQLHMQINFFTFLIDDFFLILASTLRSLLKKQSSFSLPTSFPTVEKNLFAIKRILVPKQYFLFNRKCLLMDGICSDIGRSFVWNLI